MSLEELRAAALLDRALVAAKEDEVFEDEEDDDDDLEDDDDDLDDDDEVEDVARPLVGERHQHRRVVGGGQLADGFAEQGAVVVCAHPRQRPASVVRLVGALPEDGAAAVGYAAKRVPALAGGAALQNLKPVR